MSQENKNLITNYSSAKYSWLKSGGKISYLYKINNKRDLIDLVNNKDINKKKILVIGNLSNTLIKDEGYKGIGIKLVGEFANVQIHSDYMIVGAAVLDNYLQSIVINMEFQVMSFIYYTRFYRR